VVVVVDDEQEVPIDGHVTRARQLAGGVVVVAVGAGRPPTDRVGVGQPAVGVDHDESGLAAAAAALRHHEVVTGRRLDGVARPADVGRQSDLAHRRRAPAVDDQLDQSARLAAADDQHVPGRCYRHAARLVRYLPLADWTAVCAQSALLRSAR